MSTAAFPPSSPRRSLHCPEGMSVGSNPMAPSTSFFARSPSAAPARKLYLRTFIGGSFATILLIFVVFSLFWGSLWHTPSHTLDGWIVDFDEEDLGRTIVQHLISDSENGKVSWKLVSPSTFPGGEEQLAQAVKEEQTWVAITISTGSSARLKSSLIAPNATYSGEDAVSVFAVEARNENAYRNIIRPYIQTTLDDICKGYAIQVAKNLTSIEVLRISPQTVVTPVSYRLVNIIPFDIPVASAVTFVGLILQLILTFFVVMMGASARTASGLERTLSTRRLISLRLVSTFTAFFFISLFSCLLSVAFQLPTNRIFGHSGFLVFWMLSWVGMLSVGLALESLVVLLTVRFIPFFMLTWVILNISVTIFPIETLPKVFHYGYGVPFYNLSRAMRTVIFGTKNRVAFDFGVLIFWIIISCTTLPLIQVWVCRRQQRERCHSSVQHVVTGAEESNTDITRSSADEIKATKDGQRS